MNRIVLIGNGFDLAHGLKTRYEDFINWYWNQRVYGFAKERTDTSEDILCTFKCLSGNTWRSFYEYNMPQFFSPLQKIEGIKVIRSILNNQDGFKVIYTPFFNNICMSIEAKKWVDIENEYYALLRHIPRIVAPKILNSQLDYLKKMLIVYLEKQEKKEIIVIPSIKDKIYRPIERREIAVANLNYSGNRDFKGVIPNNIMLLNFNYTKTEQQYIGSDSKVQVNHIHGCLDDANSVIFGYGDELDSDFEKLKNLNDNECLRNMKSIRYLEADNYRKMLEFIESGPFQVCIMGHSCGNSDRTLLNTLFEHKNCISIKPYYYIKQDGTDNYLELVQNISRNFTDMKLMRDRVVNKTYCVPLTD